MGRVTLGRRVTTFDTDAGTATPRPDQLSVEEPLEIRIHGEPLTVTMRTPGHDIELVHGFLFSEGLVRSAGDISLARYCAGSVLLGDTGVPQNTYNVVDVTLAPHVRPPSETARRAFLTSSACGVCGTASIEQLRRRTQFDVALDPTVVSARTVAGLPGALREHQRAFDRTGGVHAAGLFTAAGEPLVVREDVGRHNAVDKVVGWAMMNARLPLVGCVLMVSGRASFELVQKSVMAGIPCLAAVSAPSSLAVECAEDSGSTLIGFVRGSRLNVYTGEHRVVA